MLEIRTKSWWSLALPYLIHYTDQIVINGESIPEAKLGM